MTSEKKVLALTIIAFVFNFVLVVVLILDHKVPRVRLCCLSNNSCAEEIKKLSPKFKPIKGKPSCEMYEGGQEYKIIDNGFVSIENGTEVCNHNQYCLSAKGNALVVNICSDGSCVNRQLEQGPKESFFWTANFIIIPCLVILVLTFKYFDKIGKIPRKFLMRYLFNLTLLHISLVFTQLLQDRLLGIVTEVFAYLSYYCLISCFVWLFVLCNHVHQSLKFYLRSQDLAYDRYFQEKLETDQRQRLKLYKFCGFLIPLFLTATAFIMSEHILNSKNFSWASFQVDKAGFEFGSVFLPIAILITYGIVTFTSTGILLIRCFAQEFTQFSIERNQLEQKRFMVYLRFFLVLLISWSSYIAFDKLKFHVVTFMNVLHIVAICSTLERSSHNGPVEMDSF